MVNNDSLTIALAGEEVALLADRALFWPRVSTLLVADAHFGKAATFRAGGIFVPRGTTSSALFRLDAILQHTGAERIVFLGDLLHAKEGRSPETLRVVADWRASRAATDMLLVRGNHDRHAGDPPHALGIRCVDAPLLEMPFAFAHHPRAIETAYTIAGHVHPAVRLSCAGRQYERLPCFWIRKHVAVLPAFGDFTGLGDIVVEDGDRVFVIAQEDVVEARVELEA